jgi:peroxiredoxin
MLRHRGIETTTHALRRASLALAVAVLCAASVDAGPVSGVGADPATLHRALREHTLRSLDGRVTTLDALRGDVVVVNFWASWCTPCRRELTRLDALNTEIARRGGRVVAISVDEDIANARRFATRQRLKMMVVHDGPQGLARTLDLSHLPFTMVLNREGQVAFTTLGASEASVQGLVERTQQLVAAHPAVAEGESR